MTFQTFLYKRLKSFTYAFQGIGRLIGREPNAWVHCTAILLVTTAGWKFGITRNEWIAIILCFALVLAAEAFNTAIERLVDLVSPDYHPLAGEVKDLAAGAVLLCAIGAALVGALIFIPYWMA